MSSTSRGRLGAACALALLGASQLTPAVALADEEQLQNVTYRARVDGVARGVQITYLGQNNQLQTADPTMLPGRIFEANAALPKTQQAKMDVSVDWPYSANLHCEILVDGVIVAQADDFIAPRLTRPNDDPDYGVLTCQAPIDGLVGSTPATADPVDGPPRGVAPPP